MKVDFKKRLNGPDGKPAGWMDEQLRIVLFQIDSNDRLHLDGDKKYSAYLLGKRLLAGDGVVEMSIEEAAFLKEVCAAGFRAGAYGQIIDLIEGKQ